MYVRGIVATVGTGAPVPNGTQGEMRRLSDNSLIATLETTSGWFDYSQNGNPGPFKITWDYAAQIKIQYSKVTGPSGSADIGSLPLIFRTFTNGVISGVGSDLNITATGSDMNVQAAIGAALVQGILYDRITAGALAISAADGSNPRIDTVVVEVVPTGAGEDIEGRAELKVVAGTPAASPVAPTLTQTSSLYQFPVKDVLVGTGVSVIGSDKLTDRRVYARTSLPAGGVGTTELADGSVTTAKIADLNVTTGKIANDAITTGKIAAGAVGTTDIADNAITSVKLAANAVTGAKLNDDIITQYMLQDASVVTAKIADGAVTAAKMAATGSDLFMPVSEFVATGALSSGTRTLITLGVGPLPVSVEYAVFAYFGVTLRNDINTGTVIVKGSIDGGTERTHEFQNVGGVPRWAPITQSALVTKNPSASFNVVMKVSYGSGDTTSIRAGWVQVIAIPSSVLVGA